MGEARPAECWGVVYNVTFPPQAMWGVLVGKPARY